MEYGTIAGETDLYEQLARIGKVVAHPKRIELLQLLCQAERSVDALGVATNLKISTISAHLQVMRYARLVETRREGTRVYYRTAGEEVCRFVTALSDLGSTRLAEVENVLRAISAGSGADRMTRAELLERVRTESVVVLDVRPTEEYLAGHITGAVSLPLEHLEARLDQLDPYLEIVAYCRGPLCLLAPEAVAKLNDRGRRACSLEDGLPEWRQAGLPITVGADAASGVLKTFSMVRREVIDPATGPGHTGGIDG